jgi:diketogulonate reductase-like aldo/keto reductase
MSYSSLGSNYHPHPDIHRNTAVMEACRAYGIAPEAVMLRMNTEQGFAALFSTSSLSHLHSNLQEVPDEAYREIFARMDQEFPAPDHGYPLVKI